MYGASGSTSEDGDRSSETERDRSKPTTSSPHARSAEKSSSGIFRQFARRERARKQNQQNSSLDASTWKLLENWLLAIEGSLTDDSSILESGAQGVVYLCTAVTPAVAVKLPAGKGPRRWLLTYLLHRECRIYQRLSGIKGIPKCHGLLLNRALVLEYVAGVPRHTARITNHKTYFDELFSIIVSMHLRGVAHGDLQNKNNLLVVDGCHPCVLDFGVATIRKSRFAPLNHLLFAFLRRLDLNTWVKLKYKGRLDNVSEDDLTHYRRTVVEKTARGLKQAWKHVASWTQFPLP